MSQHEQHDDGTRTRHDCTPASLHVSAPGSDLSVDLPVSEGAIRATDLRKIPTDDGGLMSYDPAFLNTASCQSAITYIDGDAGILRYRGYPIEQLAGKATFLEVAWLLRHGELPNADASTTRGCTTSRSTRTCTRT